MKLRPLNIRLLLILLAVTVVVGSGMYALQTWQVRRNAGVFLVEARHARDEGRLREAVESFQWYLQLVPNDVDALGDLGLVLADLDAYRPAYNALEQALRLDPDRIEARRRLVAVAIELRRHRDARTHLVDYLLKESPDDAELLAQLGRCEAAAGQFEAAVDAYRRALAGAPCQLETYARLAGLLRHRLERPAEADGWMEKLIAQNPDSAAAHVLMGGYAEDLGRPDEALRHARRALEIEPGEPNALFLAARACVAKQRYEEARDYAVRALEHAPENAALYTTLAEVEGHQGRRAESIAWLRRGLEANPAETRLLWTLAVLLLDDRQVEEARAAVEQLEQADYHRPLVEYLHARVLLAEQQWLAAGRRFEQTRPHLTDWPDLLKQVDLYLGICYQQLGNVDQQLTAFRRAVAVDPFWVPARAGLAAALRSTGRIEEALDEYRQIMRLDRAPAAGWIDLARLTILRNLRREPGQRDWAEVTRLLDQAAKANPDDASVTVLRAEVEVARQHSDEARRLLEEAVEADAENVELRLALAALAQRERDFDAAERILDETRRQLGDSVAVRLGYAQCWVRRHGAEAAEQVRTLADDTDALPDEQLPQLWLGLARMSLQAGEFEHTRTLCRRLTEEQPNQLRIWLLLFDLALRAEDDSDIAEVLEQIRRIEGEGPLWQYGRALHLVLRAQGGKHDQLPEALDLLTRAATARPAWARVPLLLAQVYEIRGEEELALRHLTEAVELGERNPGTIRRAIELLARRQRFLEADRLIRRLEEQATPFSHQLGRLAAEVSLALDDFDRALDMARHAAAESDHYADHLWLGQVLGILGQRARAEGRTDEGESLLGEAERQFRRAVEMQPDEAAAWVALIRFYGRTDEAERADEVIAEARETIPGGMPTLALAQCYEGLGRTDDARQQYESALADDPDNPALARRVAEFYLRTGNPEPAEVQLRRIAEGRLEADEADVVWGRRGLALMLADRGGYENLRQGLALVEKNLGRGEPAPEDRRAMAVLLASHPRRSQRRRAVGVLEELLAQDPDPNPQDRFVLARLYLRQGDWTNGARHMRALLASSANDPRHGMYVSMYIRALLDREELGEAERWLNQLERVAPEAFSTVMLRADALVHRRRYDEAVAVLTATLQGPDMEEQERLQRVGLVGSYLADLSLRLRRQDRPDAAEQLAEAAETLYREYLAEHPGQQLLLTTFLGRMGRVDEALDTLEAAWEDAPPRLLGTALLVVLQETYDAPDQRHRAETVLVAALEKHERPRSLMTLLADLRSIQGDHRQAESIYREILQADPRNIEAMNNLAMLLAVEGRQLGESLELIDRAIALAGPAANLLDSRASVLLALNRPKDALADLSEIAIEGESAGLQLRRAQAFEQLGDRPTARKALRAAHKMGLRGEALHPLERPVYEQLVTALGVEPEG